MLKAPADVHETLVSLLTFGTLMQSRTGDLHYLVMAKNEVERLAEASGLEIEVTDNEADRNLYILFRAKDEWLQDEANGEARRLKVSASLELLRLSTISLCRSTGQK